MVLDLLEPHQVNSCPTPKELTPQPLCQHLNLHSRLFHSAKIMGIELSPWRLPQMIFLVVNLKHLTPTVGLTLQGSVQSMNAQSRGRGVAAAAAMVRCSLMVTLPFQNTSLSQVQAQSSKHVRCRTLAINLGCCDNSLSKQVFRCRIWYGSYLWPMVDSALFWQMYIGQKIRGSEEIGYTCTIAHDMHGCWNSRFMARCYHAD